ncbi:MAG: hypothetical protein IJ268_13035 [Proteobacteria bacterium]|nr:hypothetical protein [Pseudomonadota bacterium]
MREKTEITLYKADNEPQVEIIDQKTEQPEGAFDCNFRMTKGNHIKLKALAKYAMMLDWVTNAKGEDCLNTDGILNLILDEGMTRRIKDIAKKHGFYDSDDFITTMSDCGDGDEVTYAVRYKEQNYLKRAHDEILKHIPIDDKQKDLPFDSAK